MLLSAMLVETTIFLTFGGGLAKIARCWAVGMLPCRGNSRQLALCGWDSKASCTFAMSSQPGKNTRIAPSRGVFSSRCSIRATCRAAVSESTHNSFDTQFMCGSQPDVSVCAHTIDWYLCTHNIARRAQWTPSAWLFELLFNQFLQELSICIEKATLIIWWVCTPCIQSMYSSQHAVNITSMSAEAPAGQSESDLHRSPQHLLQCHRSTFSPTIQCLQCNHCSHPASNTLWLHCSLAVAAAMASSSSSSPLHHIQPPHK